MADVNQGHVIGLTAEMEQARQKAEKPAPKQKADKAQDKADPAPKETKAAES